MVPFEEIVAEVDALKNDEKDIGSFYSRFWVNMVTYNNKERDTLFSKVERFNEMSLRTAALFELSKGMHCTFSAKYQESVQHCMTAIETFRKLEDRSGIMAASVMAGISYRSMGQLDRAQHFIQQSKDHLDDKEEPTIYWYFNGIALYQCGELCMQLKRYEDAFANYMLCNSYLDLNAELRGRLESSLGLVCMHLGKNDKAVEHFQKSLELIKGGKNMLLESKVYSDVGLFYLKNGEIDKALEYQMISLDIREKNQLLSPAITSYIMLAEIFLEKGDTEKCIEYANKAIETSVKLKTIIKLFEAHAIIYKAYESQGKIREAFDHYKKYQQYKDEVHTQEVIRRIEQINTSHQLDSAEKEKEIFRLRNVELKAALTEIHESFTYARRIQKAILPDDEYFKNTFSDAFIFYKPKDIVAGDFYWMERVGDDIYFAACDCTGHGVPGAMVSVICYNALNKSLREFGMRDTNAILDKTRELVIQEFGKSAEEVKDGMDVALCRLRGNTLQFSGANNPVWIVRDGMLTEIKGTKCPVGKHVNELPFAVEQTELKKGDILYLLSDGFADQFGGKEGKKFRTSNLQKLLISVSDKNCEAQFAEVDKVFTEWKGNMEQVDDVCVIGVRI